MTNRNLILTSTAVLATSLLAACGGGGGSNPTPVGSTPTPAPSVAASASPHPSPSAGTGTQATATGTVVDYAANTPLSGVKVSISAYTAGAAITQVATTTSTGTFSFTTAPGTYYLVIGSDSPTDTTTTLHTKITLAAGNNALTLPIPPAETDVTYTAAQMSGNFRLTALSGNQLSCFTGANSGRSADSLAQLIPDELMTETMTAMTQEGAAENVSEPNPLWSGVFSYQTSNGGIALAGVTSAGGGSVTCSSYTDAFSYTSGNDPYSNATSSSNIYYAADEIAANGSTQYGGLFQTWAADPR